MPGARPVGVSARFDRSTVQLRTPQLRLDLQRFLDEDRVQHDATSRALIAPALLAQGTVASQGEGVLSGMRAARLLAEMSGLRVLRSVADGRRVRRGTVVLQLRGPARRLLAIERTLLNLLMHLSGVATETSRAVRAAHRVAPHLVVAATRKTLPGLRDLEKAAVVDGGGDPHRRDLSSALLVKSNHRAFLGQDELLRRARRAARAGLPVLVEVRTTSEALAAARAGVGRLLLDNMTPAQVRSVVGALQREGLRRAIVVEVSGGITPVNIAAYARSGADVASLGCLTHSAPALPFHMTLRATGARRP